MAIAWAKTVNQVIKLHRQICYLFKHVRAKHQSQLTTATTMFQNEIAPFHIAFPVNDLDATREFYGNVLGCEEGRSSDHWIDFSLFGHQIVAHLKDGHVNEAISNPVDGHDVPVPHFGVVLPWDVWEQLAERVKQHNIQFVIEPYVRFKGETGEQATMFFLDPAGNALEFKAFKDMSQLFAK